MTPDRRSLRHAYFLAKCHITSCGFRDEIEWQKQRVLRQFSESDVLREAAWVILNGGMRERVIRKLFSEISTAFLEWESAALITAERRSCRQSALRVFRHTGKIDAIIAFASALASLGLPEFLRRVSAEGADYLATFPYLGPATSLHLAKNLGADCAKPDRHLMRMSRAAGYESVATFCADVALMTGDPVSVVDLVLWRFATLERSYLRLFDAKTDGCDDLIAA